MGRGLAPHEAAAILWALPGMRTQRHHGLHAPPRSGRAGEGFVRASAFGHRDNIMEAVERFKKVYGKQ